MHKTTRIYIRIKEETKVEAAEVSKKMGINLSLAVRLFLEDIARKGTFPFVLPTVEYKKSKEEELDEFIQKSIKEHLELHPEDKEKFKFCRLTNS